MTEAELRQCWETPNEFFQVFDDLYHFTLDVCAIEGNKKCAKFISPLQDGLKTSWAGEVCWCNPGFSNVWLWLKNGHAEMGRECPLSCVVTHAGTGATWFHEAVPLASETLLLTPRIPFIPPPGVKASSNSRDSALFVFDPKRGPGGPIHLFNWKIGEYV